MNLSEEPRIIGLANALGLGAEEPVSAIRSFCRTRVSKISAKKGALDSVLALQKAVCHRLRLEVREVWSDHELASLEDEYIGRGEIVFATLSHELSPDAFGILIQLVNVPSAKSARFVAVIDCRADKHLRRYWTLWHEIAHCMTAVDQYQLPLRRTTVESIEKDAVEKLTDMVAGDFAFYPPLFEPVLQEELNRHSKLTFAGAERVKARFCADASFSATVNACVAGSAEPVILLEAGLSYKKREREMLATGAKGIQPALRVSRSIGNTEARQRSFFIPRNMRVPLDSVIEKVFSGMGRNDSSAIERLESWSTSDGRTLPVGRLLVEARRTGDYVIALVSLAS